MAITKYLVVEIQTNSDGAVGNLVWAYDTRDAAESKYHAVLSAAAISGLPMHSAILLGNDAFAFESRCYTHEEAPQEEVES